MNYLLWALQLFLAFMFLSGGAYKIFQFDELAKMPVMGAMPKAAWMVVAVIEVLGAVLLVAPAALSTPPQLAAFVAAALVLESLGLTALYASHSVAIAATNPMVWSAAMGALAALLAWGRWV